MRPSTTATRYAQAAFAVAQSDGNVEAWLRDLRAATESVQSQEIAQFFRDPNVATSEKMASLGQISGNLAPHVLNLLRVLVARRRLYLLPLVLREFERLNQEAQGLTEATVTVARPMSSAEVAGITDRLTRLTGKRVHIHTKVDPAILGGIVVRIGDRLYDASVAGRLERLRQSIAV